MNFFNKISEYIKNIFGKKRVLLTEAAEERDNTVKRGGIEELSKQYSISNLQNDYEAGIVKEEMLSEDEKADLMELYKSQIETLQSNIDAKKRELEECKEKILNAKLKLSLKTNKG